MRIAYKRVSTTDQTTARQLPGQEFDRVFEDKLSGKDVGRPELQAMLGMLREGDVVHVHSLDRLARSLPDLFALIDRITASGASVHFETERLNFARGSDDPTATLMLSVLGAIAAFERGLIRKRCAEGIALAKARGVYKGRKPSLTDEQVRHARELRATGLSLAEIGRRMRVHASTILRALA